MLSAFLAFTAGCGGDSAEADPERKTLPVPDVTYSVSGRTATVRWSISAQVEAVRFAFELYAGDAAAPAAFDFSKVVIEPLFEEQVDFETFSKSDFRAVKVKECVAVPKSKKLLKFTLDDGTGADRVILSGIHAYYEPEDLVGKTLVAITNLPPRKMMGIDSCGMIISAVHEEEGEERLNLLMVDDRIPAGAKLY